MSDETIESGQEMEVVTKKEVTPSEIQTGAIIILTATYKHCPLCDEKYFAQKGGAEFLGHLTGYGHQIKNNEKLAEILVEAMKER